MAKKKANRSNSTTERPVESRTDVIVDPADKYYEQARKDREEYNKALKARSPWAEYLNDRNHEAGAGGNPHSRHGFDPGTFRNRG